ncbi:hypothetical protein BKA58DRAFT_128904 [Alternaria rosae]|uniref:uncharacterized protein n=1 Tax=Alternaria rosae TaxID=1187941 RepID=UPI001E8DD8BE|nr:uncharacterized protein BKA58DRAFT_128904 [Alternaria rosae]KAH6875795.1 hypothetical protein BKA58DRAFT_128904 [Alternaria rosae]
MASVSTPEESESSIITEDDFSENETSSSEEDTALRDPPLLQPNHFVMHPVDVEGNRLSFQVQTKPSSSIIAPSEESDTPENKEVVRAEKKEPGDNNLQIRRIIRATAIDSEAQNMLTIHTLPTLASPRLRASVATTWYHLNGNHLDFDRFETVCLTIPHLSDRLQTLTREILGKLRGKKIKSFVGGRYIEPGTVLRADESDPTDSQPVIFSYVPYFSLQQVARPTPGQEDSLFPPRTLMQALYPYESVRERDDEQSYRRFGNDPINNIVHVPSLWIMNIGSTAVVTYGHQPLPIALKNSISIVEEDIRPLGKQGITENTLTKVHITDRDGSSLIYPIGDFRSYFQLESRILHSDPSLEGGLAGEGINLKVENLDGGTTAGAGNWKNIISRAAQLVSITITIPYDQIRDGRDEEASTAEPAAVGPPTCVPPFFHWPQSKTNDLSHRSGKPVVLGITGKDRSIVCLEYVEKVMTSRYLARSTSPVEDAFTSTNYYYSLPETVCEGVSTRLSELQELVKATPLPDLGSINHNMIVTTHCRKILIRSVEFLDTVRKTLGLFVDDLDSSTILRKLSSALQNIHQQVTTIEQREAVEPYSEEYTNSDWKHPDMLNNCIWSIRTSAWEVPSSLPEPRKTLQRSIERCGRYRRPFRSATSAMTHLVRHVEKYSTGTAHPDAEIPSFKELQDWIINSVQYRRELTNASALVILTHASKIAKDFLVRAKELAEGVQNEDGHLSSSYKLPQELIHAFQKIVIYYLAIERALHENEKAYGLDPSFQSSRRLTKDPYSLRDVEVLKRFGYHARRSLRKARFLLCDMVRPESPPSLRKHLSLGPEYVSLWLMRSLLTEPLERSKTIGDMYHVYISKVQFEINHRPSKRLLRAINLIQEELQVLQLVNVWQTNLVRNYMAVIDDSTYEKIIPSRQAMYPYENALGRACLDHLCLVRQDYADLIRRCAPLSDRTKQILEINEEDHGKAIMVFTVVTVVFLPLSFVTSYFGMNA